MSNTRAAAASKANSKANNKAAAANVEALQIKGTTVPALVMMVGAADQERVEQAVSEKLAEVGERFQGELAVIDLSRLSRTDCTADLAALLAHARRFGMNPVAVRGAPEPIETAARELGLGVLPAFEMSRRASAVVTPSASPAESSAQPLAEPAPIAEEVKRNESSAEPPSAGQRVYARGRDLVVLAGVNPGAEVIADGSIHCYGVLRGRAAAGASGDATARIYASAFEAELISIAGVYKNFEQIPDELRGKALTISLHADGEQPRIVLDQLANR
jgi:septum site-determining protein MinC